MASELERIARFLRPFSLPAAPAGPGDDCAVLPRPRGNECVTTDALVDGVHFVRGVFAPADVGHKALAVNLSDLAAMGATPRWFVCALGLPGDVSASELDGIARGMAALARAHGIALVGGNVTRAPVLTLTLTAAGTVRSRALLRSGARPGDLLYVSGELGSARAGFERKDAPASLVKRQRRPEPRVELGLIATRFATAAIDVSDGLGQDVRHVCDASRVGVLIEAQALPVSAALVRAVGRERALAYALAGGEDYELALAVPARRASGFERACREKKQKVSLVGRFTAARACQVRRADGRTQPLPAGFDHFE